MFGLFKSEVIGIDFGDYAIKVAQSDFSGDTIKVQNFGVVKSGESIIKGEVVNQKLLKKKLQSLFDKEGIKAKKVVFSMSEENILHKKITIPNLPEDEMEMTIKNKIETEFNINNIKQITYSYDIIAQDDDTGEQTISIMVVEKKDRGKYEQVLEDLGLEVVGIKFEGDILYNLAQIINPSLNTIGIIDVGEHNTKVSIYNQDKLQEFRQIEIGGENFNQIINDELSPERIEGFKEKNDLLEVTEVNGLLTQLIDNVDRALNHYNIYNDNEIERLYITGLGLGKIQNLEELTQTFQLAVKRINLAPKIKGNINANIVDKILLAIGLSLEEGK